MERPKRQTQAKRMPKSHLLFQTEYPSSAPPRRCPGWRQRARISMGHRWGTPCGFWGSTQHVNRLFMRFPLDAEPREGPYGVRTLRGKRPFPSVVRHTGVTSRELEA
jgi:hypothetical protein